MEISVVIPTYRRPELLIRCLDAISKQRLAHTDFEVIVVSDGPDEKTEQALKNWVGAHQLNLAYLHHPGQKGPAAARNLGWTNAEANLVAFTDDDCIPDENWLQAFVTIADQQQSIAFTGRTIVPVADKPSDFAINTAQLQQAEFITANCACTKDALLRVSGFDERFRLAWREDSDLQFRLLLNRIPIISCENAIVIHPVRHVPWGISLKEQKKGIYDALLFKKYPMLYRNRIRRYPVWNYYITILLWLLLLSFIAINAISAIIITSTLLVCSISFFIYKRIKNTDKSFPHLVEMLITSILIPFLSVYWSIYGAIKFRVFFI